MATYFSIGGTFIDSRSEGGSLWGSITREVGKESSGICSGVNLRCVQDALVKSVSRILRSGGVCDRGYCTEDSHFGTEH